MASIIWKPTNTSRDVQTIVVGEVAYTFGAGIPSYVTTHLRSSAATKLATTGAVAYHAEI